MTSTVNLGGGTISSPDLFLNLLIVSKVISRHISKKDGYLKNDKDTELENLFDLDNFIQKELKTCFGQVGIGLGPCVYVQRRKRSSAPVPTVEQINIFLRRIFRKLSLNVECAIVALLYAERLMSQGKIAMNGRNWRPILLASILMASKMWDDLSSWNIEFSELFPIFTLKEINMLEKLFLQELNYNLFISGTEYARYYFALRGLRYTHEQKIPRHYLDFQIGGRSLEERSRLVQERSEIRHGSPKGSPADYGTSIPTKSMQIPVLPNSHGNSKFPKMLDFAESLREESLRTNMSLRRQQIRNTTKSKVGVFNGAEPSELYHPGEMPSEPVTIGSVNHQHFAQKEHPTQQDSKLLDPFNNETEDVSAFSLSQPKNMPIDIGKVDSNEFEVSVSASSRSEELSRTVESDDDLPFIQDTNMFKT